jgi:hypothetical protein
MAENYPVIVVGGVDWVGNRAPTSQGGPLMTVSAVSEDVTCASSVDDGFVYWTGNSFGISRPITHPALSEFNLKILPWD